MSDIQIIPPASADEEFVKCMDYIHRRELGIPQLNDKGKEVLHQYTIQEYADVYGVTRKTVYAWINKWKTSGLLQRAREYLVDPMAEEVIVANRKVLTAWPAIVSRQVKTALSGSEQWSLQAAIWLHEKIVTVVMEERDDPGHEERAYLESLETGSLDPYAFLTDGGNTSTDVSSDPA